MDASAVNPLTFVPSEQVIVCTSCKIAIPFQNLNTHLRDRHKIPHHTRLTILAQFDGLPAAQKIDDLQPRKDGSAPLSYLAPPTRGFRCLYCLGFKTVNWDKMRQHAKKEHSINATACTKEKRTSECFLQSWTNYNMKYWVVAELGPPNEAPSDPHSGPQLSLQHSMHPPSEEEALMRMEAEEEQRLLSEQSNSVALDEELDHDENTEWLRGCEWPMWFANKPLHLIVAAASPPSANTLDDFPLGLWNGFEIFSPGGSERVIWKIIEASKVVFRRCEVTLTHTPRVLRCWLRSWTPSFLAFPFELPQRDQTRRRYYSYHERFLCYIFRIWALSRNLKEPTSEITGLQLTTAQAATMDYIWDRMTALVKTADAGVVLQTAPDAVYENLFQLLVMFWTDLSHDGKMDRNAIVHFSGVLGIHPIELCFRKPYDYTPYLSALLWVGRLILLEYALPLTPYQHLSVPWPERTAYPDQVQRLREHIRPKYLLRGSLAPVGYIIERLQHGRAIARREGPRTNISWSPDGLTLHIAEAHIHMRQFRGTIHGVLIRTQHLAQDLLFGWWPDIQLDRIRDNLGIHRPGFSFLAHPENNLQSCFRTVSRLAFSERGACSLKKGTGKARLRRYLRTTDSFMQLLYAAVHMTSGMPARGEELRIIRWADTVAVQRNIFVYKGSIILVFAYNKANTNTNNSFYIVRSPCPAVQRLLFVYVAYIRPFRDFINRSMGAISDHPTNPHLFATHDNIAGCFSAAMAHLSLRKSAIGCPIELSTSVYRQIAVSIAKKHLPILVTPFDPNTPKDYNSFLQLLSFQAGHKPTTHAGAYALEHGFPAKLQPDLIDRYLENSHVWHEFTLTRETDILDYSSDVGSAATPSTQLVGYFPDQSFPRTPERISYASSDTVFLDEVSSPEDKQQENIDPRRSSTVVTGQKRGKRGRELDSCSPTTRRIIEMQKQLNGLLQERAASKRRKR